MFKVEFVDFGFVDDFNLKEIRIIDIELLELPPFAYKCCLRQVANLHVSDAFALRFNENVSCNQVFQMQIARTLGDSYIVELGDVTNISVEDRLNWTEGNSTFQTHFANRRRRECFFDSDGETSDGWTLFEPLEVSESKAIQFAH